MHPAFDHRIFHKECLSLVRAGHRVTLIAPYDGTDTVNGVRVVGVPRASSRRMRIMQTVPAVYRAAVAEEADVYHLHDPELLPVGVLLRLRGARVVYDVHEDLPRQIGGKPWIPRRLRRFVAACAGMGEAILSRAVSGIVAATPTIARRFPTPKTVTVRNFADLSADRFDAATPYRQRGPVLIHASSTLAGIRGAREMVAAMERLPGARLVLLGEMETRLREELAAISGWKQVDWLGRRPVEELPSHLARARIGLSVLHDLPNYRDALPTKLYEFMAAGLPIVASDFPLWRAEYGPAGCARFVDPRDVEGIADAVRWLLEHPDEAEAMGRRGRQAVESQWNW
ncbi:MAG: glycosyltransferase family 4 protein, partial [Planctomycetaceae bacterium]